jgi:hypothetical protein
MQPHLYALQADELEVLIVVATVRQQLLHKRNHLHRLVLVRPAVGKAQWASW